MKERKAMPIQGKILKKSIKSLLMILAGAAMGLVLLLLVHCLPIGPMQLHVWQSLPMLEKEFEDSEIITGFPATLTGNFTDCLMLEHSIYQSEEHSLLEQALYMYRAESGTGDGWAPGISLVDYLEGTPQPREEEYARYWHGYLVVLKPLLLLTTFTSIRILAAALQFILAGLIAMQCGRRGETVLGAAFLVSVPFLYFATMYFSLSLSICFYVLAAALLVQVKWHEKLNMRNWYGEFFLIVGMAASYFDFLTYPLVTLGFPLCVYLYLSRETWKTALKNMICFSIQWSVGYLGLWAMKWIFTDILAGGNTVADAVATLFSRTGTAEGYSKLSGFWEVLKLNAAPYLNWPFYLLGFGILLWLLYMLLKKRTILKEQGRLAAGGVIFLVAAYPAIWFFFTQNHSQQHWMFTCKILAVSVFAVICGVGKAIREEKLSEQEGGAVSHD